MNKEIPKYCFIEMPGAVYILHTQAPYYIGRVWKYTSRLDLNNQIKKVNPLAYAFIDNFCIAITLWTVLGGRVSITEQTTVQANQIMRGMADWFYENTVSKQLKHFNKFR